jgi:beta-glucanase (GH16 family)
MRKTNFTSSFYFCLFIFCCLLSCSKDDLPVATSVNAMYQFDELVLKQQGWEKQFEEDFSSGLNQWTMWNGGAFNEELQHYQPSNISLDNSILAIEARREKVTGATSPLDNSLKDFDFTSGRIESRMHFSASAATPQVRIMARIRSAAGKGMWPAFWTYGDPWPTQGEIDIMEARGDEPFRYHTAHWYGINPGINTVSNTAAVIPVPFSLNADWHVYELIWTKNSLSYICDGNLVHTAKDGYIPSLFGKSQRLVLNLAVGGSFNGYPDKSQIETGKLEVDWVKVFTSQKN